MSQYYPGPVKALVILPHFTSLLSALGSAWILVDIVKDWRRLRRSAYLRLMLAMSSSDVLNSIFGHFPSTWPIPHDSEGIYGAIGNTSTCTFQGTMVQFGIASPLYNASLALYYWLVVGKQWSEERITRIEPFIHMTVLGFSSITACVGAVLELYNNAFMGCWIAPLPANCTSSLWNDGVTTCLRGDNSSLFQASFWLIPLWISISFVTVATFKMYREVRQREQTSQQYSVRNIVSKSNRGRRISISCRVYEQGLCYVGSFYVTWICPTVYLLTLGITGKSIFVLELLITIFLPLQGALNFMVFCRPRYLLYRQRNPEWSVLRVMRQSLRSTCCCCPRNFDDEEDLVDGIVDTEKGSCETQRQSGDTWVEN